MAMVASSLYGWQFTVGAEQSADTDILTLAFRGVEARFRLRGVRGAALDRLYNRYLPDKGCPVEEEDAGCEDVDEFHDLVALLIDHRSGDFEETEWLACAIATACFGHNHLWQDMGLPDRAALSELLRGHFARLYEKNADNMKWKKFFYKLLCERMQVNICMAPTCSVCSDYHQCFGPEDG